MGKMILNGKEYTGSGSEWHEYSTDEKVVGKWLDGKPLYEKVFALNSLVLDNWNDVAHGISNIDTLCRCEATYYRTTGVQTVPMPFYESASYYALCLANKTNISYFINGYGSGKIIVILQYTKTTDT